MINGVCILDDSYNANPDSMVAAIETLGQMPGRRIAVLGQMNELGVESERGHRRVGEAAAREHIDCVITVGPIAADIASVAHEHGVRHTLSADCTTQAAALLRSLVRNGDTVPHQGQPLRQNGNHHRGTRTPMMYFLYHYRTTWSALNVFQYITFRCIAAALTSFLLSLMFGNYVIRRLIGLKVGQPIRTKEQVRELATLHGGKAGTPPWAASSSLAPSSSPRCSGRALPIAASGLPSSPSSSWASSASSTIT